MPVEFTLGFNRLDIFRVLKIKLVNGTVVTFHYGYVSSTCLAYEIGHSILSSASFDSNLTIFSMFALIFSRTFVSFTGLS